MTPSGRRSTITPGGPKASFVLVILFPPATTGVRAPFREPCNGGRQLLGSYSHADRQIENLSGFDHRFVQAVDGVCLRVPGDCEVQGVAGSQTGLIIEQIAPSQSEVVRARRKDDKRLSDDIFE